MRAFIRLIVNHYEDLWDFISTNALNQSPDHNFVTPSDIKKSVTSGTLDRITPQYAKVQDVNTQFISIQFIATDNLNNEYLDLEFQ